MTPARKRIVFALVVANVVVILALIGLVTRSGTIFSSSLSVPAPSSTTLSPRECRWEATRLLTQAGLAGTVMLVPGEHLRFEIAYPLTPGQTADEAAQQVWSVFDIALALSERRCDAFSEVQVTILAESGREKTRISASVSMEDLQAFDAGELDEEAFLDHVLYETSVETADETADETELRR